MTKAEGPALPGVAAARDAIRDGKLTASVLTRTCLDLIETYQPMLNTVITVFADAALEQARVLDIELQAGHLRGPLHGVPITLKDCIDTAGGRTTAASAIYKARVPPEDATLVARLRAAGAIIIAKDNMNEFAMSDGRSSYFGRPRNPWALDRETGGSSTGSCAGVAAGLYPGAIGTDTGGSIRNPAAWCGVVGLKPTNGLVPNRGTMPLTPSLDVCGPITRSVEDAAILLDAIAGYDELDITSLDHAKEEYATQMRRPVSGFRVGLPVGFFDRMDPEVAKAVWTAIDAIKGIVAVSREMSLPDGGAAMALMPFGETYAVHEATLKSHRFLYSAQDQATLDGLAGRKAEDYIRARNTMELLRRTVSGHFGDLDLIVYPTVHTMAPKVSDGGLQKDGARSPAALFDAGLFNVLGLPSISLPCGFGAAGLPIGLSIAGPRFAEGKILALAHAYEQMTDWHLRRPALTSDTEIPAAS